MRTIFALILTLSIIVCLCSCNSENSVISDDLSVSQNVIISNDAEFVQFPKSIAGNHMTSKERGSVKMSEVSHKQIYYDEVADVAEYIQEMSVYDEELDSTYVIHITLPPDYGKNKSYPMYMMTDGVWRLSDHAELRPMMVDGIIEDIILVSIGYDYGIDPEDVGTRGVEFVEKNELSLDFITDNLAPYLGERYSIDFKRSALFGHSLGGLFMYYAVFNHDKYENQPFEYYVMGSPSFWVVDYNYYGWNSGSLEHIEKGYFERSGVLQKKIYLTVGDKEDKFMIDGAKSFAERTKDYGITTVDYEEYDGDHVSFVKLMMHNSLIEFYGIEK